VVDGSVAKRDRGSALASATCQPWRSLIEDGGIPCRTAPAGTQLSAGEMLRLQVLHPPAQFMTSTVSGINNNSVMLRVRHARFSLLLAGDSQEEGEQLLLLSGKPLHSLVLKVPHHGGADSSSPALLKAVNPKLAVISVGADNSFGHPDQVNLEKLEGIATFRTDQQGSVEVVTDGERYWAHAER
jgi:competence protein ComEC